ncbi:hypothetical protein IPZ68_39010 [Streptomyces arenae]|nr:hypothetical protein [Streptomyces arenae]
MGPPGAVAGTVFFALVVSSVVASAVSSAVAVVHEGRCGRLAGFTHSA